MARTKRESDRIKKSGRLVDAVETSKELAKMALQQKSLSMMGLLRRKEWPQCHRENSWQVRQSRLCQKEREQSRLSKARDCKVGESQGE